jgi:hypothetical protein
MDKPVALSQLALPLPSSKEWLVHSVIPMKSLTLFTGHKESGRTAFAMMLIQGVATRHAFLGNVCAPFPVAYFNRYNNQASLREVAIRFASRATQSLIETLSVYGCWKPEQMFPSIQDPELSELAKTHVLVMDTIPEPRDTPDEDPDEFLRKAQALAHSGPGVILFGSDAWDVVPSVRNRVQTYFTLSKKGNNLTLDAKTYRSKSHIELRPDNQYDGAAFSLGPSERY